MINMKFFGQYGPGIELAYTLIIVVLCLIVYFKTKEIYDLTKHKGIQYFRNSFLFFALSYISRLLVFILIVSFFNMEVFCRGPLCRGKFLFPIFMIPAGYFSTIAIFYLTYSHNIWKKIKYKHFLIISNVIAISFSIFAFISRSPELSSLLQVILIVATLIMNYIKNNSKKSKKSKSSVMQMLYSSTILFWLINLLLTIPGRIIHHEIKVIFQILSIMVFIIITQRVFKWTK